MSLVMDYTAPPTLRFGMKGAALWGIGGLIVLVGVLGLWAATTMIGGAIISSGQVVVRGDAKVVQSLDGGVVHQILAQDGDIVAAGQTLLQLDPELLQINLDIAHNRLAAALALQARLQAEQRRDMALTFTYPPLPFDLPDTTAHEAGQLEIFAARQAVFLGSQDQLGETLAQIDNQQRGVEGQITALTRQIALVDEDLANIERLASQGLARQTQVSDKQTQQAELAGRLAALEADVARLSNVRRDSELSTLQAERSFMESVVTELRATTAQAEELVLEIVTRSAQLDRVDVRAPADGIIHEMQVTTVGGVIAPGETILQVIPLDDGLEFELQIDPRDIDQAYIGQPAQIIIAAFNAQTTPKLNAQVANISAGAITDTRSGQSYYRLGLTITPEEIARLGDVRLVPGMPLEAFLETGDRTILQYMLNPLSIQLERAFRE